MMNDDTYEKLNDYLDGQLPDAVRRAFESELAADPELHAEAEALRALHAEASALPRAIAPDRDLWVGIAERLCDGSGEDSDTVVSFRRDRAPRRVSTWTYLVAAAAMLLLMLSLPTLLNRTQPPVQPDLESVATVPDLPDDAEFKRVAQQYVDARDQLVALLEERRADIAPETLAVVEENLKVIASAVSEIEMALVKEPQSPKLERMLYAVYRSEVDLLQQAVQLAEESAASNEADEAKGDGDAA